jgi:hypothetical protein
MKQKAPLIVQYQELLQRLLKLRLKPTPRRLNGVIILRGTFIVPLAPLD